MSQPLFGNADNNIVVAINNCHSPFMDNAILVITDFWFFVGVVCCIIAYSIRKDKLPKIILFCALLIVAVGCTDYLCASIIRPAVQQLRPTNPDNPVSAMLHIVRGYIGGKYGFPSCHAAKFFRDCRFYYLMVQKKMDCRNTDMLGFIGVLHPFVSWRTLSIRYSFWNGNRKSDSIYCL